MNKKHFFCYDVMLHKYLHNKHKIKYICTARHENTYEKFWLYERTGQLTSAIDEYNKIFKR